MDLSWNNIKSLLGIKTQNNTYIPELKSSNDWYNTSNFFAFNGEKTPNELGNPIDLYVDYYTLRSRSWEAFLTTDTPQNIIKKYCLWLVGTGLKLQSEPEQNILQRNGIKLPNNFNTDVEASFRLWAKSKLSTYAGNHNLHIQASEALKNAMLAGDVLNILRFDGKNITHQLIDGVNVQTPMDRTFIDEVNKRGNVIIDGVEIDKKGQHIAYYVLESNMKYTMIPARGSKSGRLMAWLMYNDRHKLAEVRGLSIFSSLLETSSKMDRYKDAAIGSAEEIKKIPFTIEHNQFSTGENPMTQQISQAFTAGSGVAKETSFDSSEGVASKVALSTSKQVYNMPVGSTLKRNTTPSDVHFKEFWEANAEVFYSTAGMPIEVGLEKFSGAYSGSRAAQKSWEFSFTTKRVIILEEGFYKPIYNFWLEINALQNKINLPGYFNGDNMVKEAYRNCRFIGPKAPHIDPVKEANAERIKLGDGFKYVPLSTAEQACENLGSGDYPEVIKKAENEKKLASSFDVEPVEPNNGAGFSDDNE